MLVIVNESAILKIIKHLEEDVYLPKTHWDTRRFKQQSYARAALNDILARLMNKPNHDPHSIVEEYIIEMVIFSRMAKTKDAKLMFDAARYIAENAFAII